MDETYDIVIIGCGAAGLAAAVTCLEETPDLSIAILERTVRNDRGGNSRWTGAYLRLADEYSVADHFVDEMMAFSRHRSDEAYIRELERQVPETMDWLQSLGIRLERLPTIFVTRSRPRLLPVGGGERLVDVLATVAEGHGAEIHYETTAFRLVEEDSRSGYRVLVRARDGRSRPFQTRSVVIASGGFEGNPEMMVRYLGPGASALRPIAPGGYHNKGEGISMALDLGAMGAGEWDNFHAEPVDPRSTNPEPVVMVFPYGVIVNVHGERFIDEGAGTADEIYEEVARAIWRQDNHIAYLIADQTIYQIEGYEHALLTDKPPWVADSIGELAALIGVDRNRLEKTIDAFNSSSGSESFDPLRLDGKETRRLYPPKSNWAKRLDSPPFVAYPIACAIVFTFGGIATDTAARVVSQDLKAIPGLFAAGECTGLYYHKYPGATSVLRSLVFGRIAGRNAAAWALQSRLRDIPHRPAVSNE